MSGEKAASIFSSSNQVEIVWHLGGLWYQATPLLCRAQMKKEWICSERLIIIYAIVKGWTCQGSLIWHQSEVTREQAPITALVSFASQRNMCPSMRRAQHLGYWLRLPCSGLPAGFISTCLYLSKLQSKKPWILTVM